MLKPTTAVLLTFAFLLTACGRDPAPEVEAPSWATVAPEQIAAARKHGVPVAFENDIGMRFVLIPAGTFLMGSLNSPDSHPDECPQHEVELTSAYYLQTTEVTNTQFRHFRPTHSSERDGFEFKLDGPEQPVVFVTWDDTRAFAKWLTSRDPRRVYRLPTEAEWEYACRAGTTTRFSWGESEEDGWQYANSMDPVTKEEFELTWDGWPHDDGYRGSAPVGSYPANPWGLHDMHGNATEWCADWYGPYTREGKTDPTGPDIGRHRVKRGGEYYLGCGSSTYRFGHEAKRSNPLSGFRLVSPLPAGATGRSARDTRELPVDTDGLTTERAPGAELSATEAVLRKEALTIALDATRLSSFMTVLAMDRAGASEAASLGMTEEQRAALIGAWQTFQTSMEALPDGAPWLEKKLAQAAQAVRDRREHLADVRRLLAHHRTGLVDVYDEGRARELLGERLKLLYDPHLTGKRSPPPPVPLKWPDLSAEQHVAARRLGVPARFENDLGMRFVLIPSGTFQMGSPEDEKNRKHDESLHQVTITQAYYMQVTEVTNGQYRWWRPVHRSGTGQPSEADQDDWPVLHLRHTQAAAFASWLSRRSDLRNYALPTEAQWEMACRAGTTTPFGSGTTTADALRVGWLKSNADENTHPVASRPANRFGLFDMHGNVYEWCADWYQHYALEPQTDPRGPTEEDAPVIDIGEHPWRPRHSRRKVLRGGSFIVPPGHARSAARAMTNAGDSDFHIGFRLVSPLSEMER